VNARQTVTTIGWIWVGLGVLAFFSGTGGFLVSSIQGLPSSPLPVRSALMDFLWQHYREGAAIQAGLAVFIVLTAFMLLRRKSWARVALQILSAAFLTWTVLFGIWWIRSLAVFASDSAYQHLLLVFRIFMSVGGALVMGAFAFAFGLCIWTLGRSAVRKEFRIAKQES
jgi:hypothetical protein